MNLKYMKVSLFEMLQEKMNFFHDILIYWDAPVHVISKMVARVWYRMI